MKKRILYVLLLLCASSLLLSCTGVHEKKLNASDSQDVITKKVEIFGSIFEVDDSWLIQYVNENNVCIYFQNPKPDPVYDAVSIFYATNVLSGTTDWGAAKQYINLYAKSVAPQFFDGEYEINDYYRDKTPGCVITGQSKTEGYSGTYYCFMNNYNDVIAIIYYHKDEGIDYSSRVDKMVISMELSFDGFTLEKPQGSTTFTNQYGTPTTKCAHSGCTNYIASSGDTNCCTVHSNKCANCGAYIDEDATYCMSCLKKAAKQSQGSSSFTNQYGTPTTKCAHPGCSNYIASSGDTNCCTVHSKRCANCGVYIDEDATYCSSCLKNSFGH